MSELTSSPHYKASRIGDSFVLEIPAGKHPAHRTLLVFQAVLLCIGTPLAICGFLADLGATNQVAPSRWAMAVIACVGPIFLAMLPASACVLYALAWEFRGVETVVVGRGGITRTLTPPPLLGARVLHASDKEVCVKVVYRDLANLRPFRQIDSAFYFLGWLPGPVVVRFGEREVSLGNGLVESEAHEVADLIRSHIQATQS